MPNPAEIEAGLAFEREGSLDAALAHFRAVSAHPDPRTSALALTHLADVHRCRGDWEAALEVARRAQRTARSAGLADELTEAVIAEGNVLMCRGDFDGAVRIFVDVLRATHDPRVRGIALQNLGAMLAQQGALDEAQRAFADSAECFAHAGYRRGEVIALNNQGRAALDSGAAARASELLERATALASSVGDTELIALAQLNHAEALAALEDRASAEALASAALGHFAAAGNRWRQIECLRLMGALHERRGDGVSARRCYERGLRLAEEIDAPLDRAALRGCLTRLERGVG